MRQFETKVENCLIKLEYSEQTKNIFLTRFEIHKSLSSEKYQDLFIKSVLDLLVEENCKVVPTCPIVVAFFKKHRSEYKHLLPAGITI
ncbi:GNAT family N-acetyltransferase [Flavobacterium sp. CS20]|uniref:GNAT family N-acetyltransferase n=1 Tax=Flavobacterium sp. CS20 TaxID=2775246 RepID=UPI001B3A6CC2|nr:N-acetyltransferase [Flavobacterium sp. CS20]QTY27257.1 N-acetyltransferase [Flavobacterium sp. CS20]